MYLARTQQKSQTDTSSLPFRCGHDSSAASNLTLPPLVLLPSTNNTVNTQTDCPNVKLRQRKTRATAANLDEGFESWRVDGGLHHAQPPLYSLWANFKSGVLFMIHEVGSEADLVHLCCFYVV